LLKKNRKDGGRKGERTEQTHSGERGSRECVKEVNVRGKTINPPKTSRERYNQKNSTVMAPLGTEIGVMN